MSSSSTTLTGPPELYKSKSAAAAAGPTSPTKTTGNPFVDLMVADFNKIANPPAMPPMGYTENCSPTFLSSGNPCLDFFFHVVPNTPAQTLTERLELAWAHNPLTTLKLVCNLRGVRGTGKSDKEGYYTAALWLHSHHPKTLACNVVAMADFGYFKDLPEILYRLLEGSDARQKAKQEWLAVKGGINKKAKGGKRVPGRFGHGHIRKQPFSFGGSNQKKHDHIPFSFGGKQKVSDGGRRAGKEVGKLASMKKAEIEKKNASKQKEEKKIAMAKKAVERYGCDPDYRFLYERVSDFFADCLKNDLQLLNSGLGKGISLAAKWCPSLDSSFDKYTLLCESIARKVFPKELHKEYEGVEDAHYAYRVRDRLRKEVLVPLRKVLELPEVYIGSNQWGSIPYNRVASVAMKFYKEKFLEHDKERFEGYLEKVKSGKATIAAGALLPHEIIGSLNDGDGGQVAELQWKRMVDDLSNKGKLKNCIAVCDVSDSMSGEPMEVCVALGMLVSELSEEPWSGKVITFSANPQLHKVEGKDLRSKSEFVRRMDWGMNTDFQEVFDLILNVAVNGNLKPEEMIKRIFVFSDMEFDQARKDMYGYGRYAYGHGSTNATNAWETDYQAITRKFTEKGYGSCVPEIVFWNLRDSKATPVPGNQPGVALVSGFSKNLMTLFLEDNGALNPESVMEAAIAGDEYSKLVVLD